MDEGAQGDPGPDASTAGAKRPRPPPPPPSLLTLPSDLPGDPSASLPAPLESPEPARDPQRRRLTSIHVAIPSDAMGMDGTNSGGGGGGAGLSLNESEMEPSLAGGLAAEVSFGVGVGGTAGSPGQATPATRVRVAPVAAGQSSAYGSNRADAAAAACADLAPLSTSGRRPPTLRIRIPSDPGGVAAAAAAAQQGQGTHSSGAEPSPGLMITGGTSSSTEAHAQALTPGMGGLPSLGFGGAGTGTGTGSFGIPSFGLGLSPLNTAELVALLGPGPSPTDPTAPSLFSSQQQLQDGHGAPHAFGGPGQRSSPRTWPGGMHAYGGDLPSLRSPTANLATGSFRDPLQPPQQQRSFPAAAASGPGPSRGLSLFDGLPTLPHVDMSPSLWGPSVALASSSAPEARRARDLGPGPVPGASGLAGASAAAAAAAAASALPALGSGGEPQATSQGEIPKGCICKKTRCLKLYCLCFSGAKYCSQACSCVDCYNNAEHSDDVIEARKKARTKNPTSSLYMDPSQAAAFAGPSQASQAPNPEAAAELRAQRLSLITCTCRRSRCLKRYCECFKAGKSCGSGCTCQGCENGKSEAAAAAAVAAPVAAAAAAAQGQFQTTQGISAAGATLAAAPSSLGLPMLPAPPGLPSGGPSAALPESQPRTRVPAEPLKTGTSAALGLGAGSASTAAADMAGPDRAPIGPCHNPTDPGTVGPSSIGSRRDLRSVMAMLASVPVPGLPRLPLPSDASAAAAAAAPAPASTVAGAPATAAAFRDTAQKTQGLQGTAWSPGPGKRRAVSEGTGMMSDGEPGSTGVSGLHALSLGSGRLDPRRLGPAAAVAHAAASAYCAPPHGPYRGGLEGGCDTSGQPDSGAAAIASRGLRRLPVPGTGAATRTSEPQLQSTEAAPTLLEAAPAGHMEGGSALAASAPALDADGSRADHLQPGRSGPGAAFRGHSSVEVFVHTVPSVSPKAVEGGAGAERRGGPGGTAENDKAWPAGP